LKTRLKVVKAEVDILISSLFLQNLLEMQNFFANCKISMFALNFCEIACLQKNAQYKMQNNILHLASCQDDKFCKKLQDANPNFAP
jgi:hypothetical protein